MLARRVRVLPEPEAEGLLRGVRCGGVRAREEVLDVIVDEHHGAVWVRGEVEGRSIGARDRVGREEARDAGQVVVRADGDDERDVVGKAGVAGRQEPEPAREAHAHDAHRRPHALAQRVRRFADRVRGGALDAVVEQLGDLRREDDDAARRHRPREAHESRLFDPEAVHARDEDDRAARWARRDDRAARGWGSRSRVRWA